MLDVYIAANLVEAGNRRARTAGLSNCRFQEGDASDLHDLEDGAFDLVVSMFGAMFAPKPFDVAKEMARVTRPGGRIVMGNWIPDDPTLVAQILKISSAYSPAPPEGFVSPMTWGIENNVIERFGAAGVPRDSIAFVRDTYAFRFASPPAVLVDAFIKYYGPTMNAFDAAEKNGRGDRLRNELDDLLLSQNKSWVADATLIPATSSSGDRRALIRENAASTLKPRLRIWAWTGNGRRRKTDRRSPDSGALISRGARYAGHRHAPTFFAFPRKAVALRRRGLRHPVVEVGAPFQFARLPVRHCAEMHGRSGPWRGRRDRDLSRSTRPTPASGLTRSSVKSVTMAALAWSASSASSRTSFRARWTAPVP